MADMSIGNLNVRLSMYITNNYKRLSFIGINNDLKSIKEVSTTLKNSYGQESNYEGEGIYPFEGSAKLELKSNVNGLESTTENYGINGKVHISEGVDSPIFKINGLITVWKK